MYISSDRRVSNAIGVVAAPAPRVQVSPETPDAFYRALGMALASGISTGFWIAVLTVTLPAIGIIPTTAALALTGVGIAATICATLAALSYGH